MFSEHRNAVFYLISLLKAIIIYQQKASMIFSIIIYQKMMAKNSSSAKRQYTHEQSHQDQTRKVKQILQQRDHQKRASTQRPAVLSTSFKPISASKNTEAKSPNVFQAGSRQRIKSAQSSSQRHQRTHAMTNVQKKIMWPEVKTPMQELKLPSQDIKKKVLYDFFRKKEERGYYQQKNIYQIEAVCEIMRRQLQDSDSDAKKYKATIKGLTQERDGAIAKLNIGKKIQQDEKKSIEKKLIWLEERYKAKQVRLLQQLQLEREQAQVNINNLSQCLNIQRQQFQRTEKRLLQQPSMLKMVMENLQNKCRQYQRKDQIKGGHIIEMHEQINQLKSNQQEVNRLIESLKQENIALRQELKRTEQENRQKQDIYSQRMNKLTSENQALTMKLIRNKIPCSDI